MHVFILFVSLCVFFLAVWIYTSTGFQFASQSFPVYARNTPISCHALKYCALDPHFVIAGYELVRCLPWACFELYFGSHVVSISLIVILLRCLNYLLFTVSVVVSI